MFDVLALVKLYGAVVGARNNAREEERETWKTRKNTGEEERETAVDPTGSGRSAFALHALGGLEGRRTTDIR